MASQQTNQLQAPAPIRTIANYLRGTSSGVKPHTGVLGGQRRDYFKGSKAVTALLSPAYGKLKNVPPVKTEDEAKELLHSIIPYAFFVRVDKGQKLKEGGRLLQINQRQLFDPELHYVWLYDGSQVGTMLAAVGMVAVMLAGVMFPLWPPIMRQGVWYLSIGVLGLIGLFIVTAIVRLIFYIITLAFPRQIWLFPNLFADCGFFESFVPVWDFDVPPPPKKKRNAAVGGRTAEAGAGGGSIEGPMQARANLPGVGPAAEPTMTSDAQEVTVAPAQTNANSPPPSAALSETAQPARVYDKLDELD